MYITVFKCTTHAIQKALLDIMNQNNNSEGSQRIISLAPSCDKLSSSHLESLLQAQQDIPLHRYTAFFYTPLNLPNFACMVATVEDGWHTLFNVISLKMYGESYRIHIPDDENDLCSFQSYHQGKERVVYVEKEPKLLFYERGERLSFEQSKSYSKRRIKDRLNESILLDYLLEVGIDARHSSFYYSKNSILAFYYAW